MYTIGGLSPDTVYALQLRAHTGVGAGPPSNMTVMTCKLWISCGMEADFSSMNVKAQGSWSCIVIYGFW